MNYWEPILQNHTEEFLAGVKAGIEAFAIWKNGMEYVGCGRLTKQEALVEVDEAWRTTHQEPQTSGLSVGILSPAIFKFARKMKRSSDQNEKRRSY